MWSEHSTLTLVLATIVAVVSIARTARLLTYDEFPPALWLRTRFIAALPENSPWSKIAECQYCIAPYLTLGMFGWAYLSDLHWTWWVINGWWSASYAAAIVMSYDEPA